MPYASSGSNRNKSNQPHIAAANSKLSKNVDSVNTTVTMDIAHFLEIFLKTTLRKPGDRHHVLTMKDSYSVEALRMRYTTEPVIETGCFTRPQMCSNHSSLTLDDGHRSSFQNYVFKEKYLLGYNAI
jgi:hypothetical protein